MLKEGQIVKLDNSGEYIVLCVKQLHDFNYVYLVDNNTPLNNEPHDFRICANKRENKTSFTEITSTGELEYALDVVMNDNKVNEDIELVDVSKTIRENSKVLEQITEDSDQLDKDQLLMRQIPRTGSRMYGNDTFDRYMSHNLYSGDEIETAIKSSIDIKTSMEKYISMPKGNTYLIVGKSDTIINIEKLKSDFYKSLPKVVEVVHKLMGEERPSDKEIEEEYMKRLAA